MFGLKSRREKKLEDMVLHLNAVIRKESQECLELRKQAAALSEENLALKSKNSALLEELGERDRRAAAWSNLLNFDGRKQVEADGTANG